MYDEIFAKGIEIVKKIEETQEDALQKAAARLPFSSLRETEVSFV